MSHHRMTAENQAAAIHQYQSGATTAEIARSLGFSPQAVSRLLRLKGIRIWRPKTLEERFWSKVKKAEGDGCWEWQAAKVRGYGAIGIGGNDVESAHRVAWKLTSGDPGNLWVLHKCDNPSCVRPDHLYLGTHDDNWRDMVARKRTAVGVRHGMAKLTPELVMRIRERYAAGEVLHKIADDLGIDMSHISQVARGIKWGWLPGAVMGRLE